MAEVFRIGGGGSLQRLEGASHLFTLRRRILAFVGVTWVPLLLLAAAERLVTGTPDPMLLDLSVHLRLAVTVPLLLFADQLLDRSSQRAVARVLDEGFVTDELRPHLQKMLDAVGRWRDSSVPEAVMLAVAVTIGLGALVGAIPPAGMVHGIYGSEHTAAHAWYALISLPLFQLVLWRALFRWALWVRVLIGLARLPLRLVPGHADRCGGIGFLKQPSVLYCAVLLLATSSALCGGWATQILLYGKDIDTLKPLFFAFVIVGALIAFAPLLAFIPVLFRTRLKARREYGELVTRLARDFERRWCTNWSRPELLGHPDFSSLTDLSTSYRENVERMQLLLFGIRDVALLFIAAQVPSVPIVLSQVPAQEVFGKLLKLVTGAGA